MTLEEYMKLFHDLQLNLVAFNPLLQCNEEVLKLVNAAIAAEREACANIVKSYIDSLSHEPEMDEILKDIQARGNSEVG